MMNEFLVALQFLTRIRLVRELECDERTFGRSVKFFTLVGLFVGGLLAAVAFATGGWLPGAVRSTLLVALSLFLTGGLHCDGLMDTADGVLSGRSRDRMLEIMKDSRVGSFGAIALVLLLLGKWSLIYDMPGSFLPYALVAMPVCGRWAMTVVVLFFPYARPEGMGKAFADYAGKNSLGAAVPAVGLMLLILYWGAGPLAAGVSLLTIGVSTLFAVWFGHRLTKSLGGLTGDIYGATTELTELLALLTFVLSVYIR